MGVIPYRELVDDALLVQRARAGERDAWAAIYDRYADKLHDYCWSILRDHHEAEDALHDAFVAAAGRLSQLRDPSRLRPWLYAICRTQALARARKRSKLVPTERVADMTAPATDEPAVEQSELARLVQDAAGGLAARDRAVLDLHLRHGFDGAELGESLGVGAHHATVLLSRVRAQVERSLGALLVARTGRPDCQELGRVLAGWDGTLSPLLRKRVARHVDDCEVCGERRRRMVSPLALLAAAPPVLAPTTLRDRVLDSVLTSATGPTGGSAGRRRRQGGGRPRSRRRWLAGAAAVALVVAGVAVLAGGGAREDDAEPASVAAGPSDGEGEDETTTTVATALPSTQPATVPSTAAVTTPVAPATTRHLRPPASTTSTTRTPAAAPPVLVIGTPSLDFGTAATSAELRFSNTGGQNLLWSVERIPVALAVTSTSGVLAPGARATLAVTLDRSAAAEGALDTGLLVSGRGALDGSAVAAAIVSARATVEHPPALGDLATDRPRLVFASPVCPTTRATATVTDESGFTVVLTWRQAVGTPKDVAMNPLGGGRYGATIGPVASPGGGDVTWSVTATDARGNQARSPERTLPVGGAC